MIVIPAIDLKAGQAVRLEQGRMDRDKVYSSDPAEVARKFAEAGAELIHVVDLDGAFQKKPVNLAAIDAILKATAVPLEVGGGIRDLETIAFYLERGVSRVILGTAAHRNPKLVRQACEKFPGRVVVGIDARDGRVAVEGWAETTPVPAEELARRYQGFGVRAIIFTDIARDGMMTGPAIESTRRVLKAVAQTPRIGKKVAIEEKVREELMAIADELLPINMPESEMKEKLQELKRVIQHIQIPQIPVIASGGVSKLQDICDLLPLAQEGLEGVITGRAVYEGTLDLAQAIALTKGK